MGFLLSTEAMELALVNHVQHVSVRIFAIWFLFYFYIFCLPTFDLLPVIVETHPLSQHLWDLERGRILLHFRWWLFGCPDSHFIFLQTGKLTQAGPMSYDLLGLFASNDAKKQRERRLHCGYQRCHSVQRPRMVAPGSVVLGRVQSYWRRTALWSGLMAVAVLGSPDWTWVPIWAVANCLDFYPLSNHFPSLIPKHSWEFCESSVSSINCAFFLSERFFLAWN